MNACHQLLEVRSLLAIPLLLLPYRADYRVARYALRRGVEAAAALHRGRARQVRLSEAFRRWAAANQLQDAIYQIEHQQGVVKAIDQDSQQLAAALVDGTKIVITTLQKFPFVLRGLQDLLPAPEGRGRRPNAAQEEDGQGAGQVHEPTPAQHRTEDLDGVQAVQTLSRLNRMIPGKDAHSSSTS